MDPVSTTHTTDGPIPLMKSAPVASSTPLPETPPVVSVLPPSPPQPKGSWGSLISIVLIVFVITVAAFYSWGERLAMQAPPSVHTDATE